MEEKQFSYVVYARGLLGSKKFVLGDPDHENYGFDEMIEVPQPVIGSFQNSLVGQLAKRFSHQRVTEIELNRCEI